MTFTLPDKDYKEYLKKKEYIHSIRIRPDNKNLFDWLLFGDANMRKTPEGRQLISELHSLWQEKIVKPFVFGDTFRMAYESEWDKMVMGTLKECTTRESIGDAFKRYGITDTQEKIDRLNQCMGNPQTFFSPNEVSLEDTLSLTIQMFLTMSWKLNEIYDKIESIF
jgi:hypothetical protein